MVSTRKTNYTPVAAPLNREEACQRTERKYIAPSPRARKRDNKVSRQTLAAREKLLDLACEDDDFTERYGARRARRAARPKGIDRRFLVSGIVKVVDLTGPTRVKTQYEIMKPRPPRRLRGATGRELQEKLLWQGQPS